MRYLCPFEASCLLSLNSENQQIPPQCKEYVLIPLGCKITPELIGRIREYIMEHVPTRVNLRIISHGKYLEFEIGPEAGQLVWKDSHTKYLTRANLRELPTPAWLSRSIARETA